jgi:hypothetical protein
LLPGFPSYARPHRFFRKNAAAYRIPAYMVCPTTFRTIPGILSPHTIHTTQNQPYPVRSASTAKQALGLVDWLV